MDPTEKIKEATRYIDECGWWLTITRGFGDKPKAPIFAGWPDLRPPVELVQTYLASNWDAGIGINLGGSRLFDVEADSDDGEALLDDLCRGYEFPCWQSRRGKHRLFLADEGDIFVKDSVTLIEFRTGRHQSVLPPSVINGTTYQWITDPFTVPVPPLPDGLRQFYEDRRPKGASAAQITTCRDGFEFRDHFDYLLKGFDLLKEVRLAGLRLAADSPDQNGNVLCFVPEKLRGRPDNHPSGLFNVKSGSLLDFADGKNFGFIRVMATLKGEDWRQTLARFEQRAGPLHGRPHSRRVSLPSHWTEERQSLEDARTMLNQYFDEQLDREPRPKTLHIIKGPPGLGKTFGLCGKLAEKTKRAVILTLENELADHHRTLLPQAMRMPVLRKDGCILPDEYEATSRRGFQPSQGSPCQRCKIGPQKCPYLLKFGSLQSAEQLCCAAVYHTHADCYSSHGNENRPIVIFDENCIDLLLEPVSTDLDDWRAWLKMASQSGQDVERFRSLVEWLGVNENKFLLKTTPKFLPLEIPSELKGPIETDLLAWLNANAHRFPNVRNLYRESMYLLSQPGSHVLFERCEGPKQETAKIRFRIRHPLPEEKEVFVLDATANEDLLRAIAPEWDIRVWECPAIQQAGRITQIMDYDLSRNRIRREVSGHEPDNPSWLPQVVDRLLEKHGPAALISFKEVVDGKTDLLSLLKHRDKIVRLDNFPCRGHTFDEKTLIVIGTPYKDEACVWEFAMALWGKDGLPESEYRRHEEIYVDFRASNRCHEEENLRPIKDFILSADLVQAIGRVRPLQNDVQVFVLSNAVITGWQVHQRMATELFDIRWHKRADAADNQKRYNEAANALLNTGEYFGNKQVCAQIDMPVRTGQQYWSIFKTSCPTPLEHKQGFVRPQAPPNPSSKD